MSLYASDTSVPVDRSKSEIERLLRRYGAAEFASGWSDEKAQALIGFAFNGKRVQFLLPLPTLKECSTTDKGRARRGGAAEAARDQEERRRWRALGLLIKAKLEAVATGITIFEEEFLAHIVVRGGRTIGRMLLPTLAEACDTGKLPPLLPGIGETGKGRE